MDIISQVKKKKIKSFELFLSFELFKKIENFNYKNNIKDVNYQEHYEQDIENILLEPFKKYLLYLKQNNQINFLENQMGHITNFGIYWNKICHLEELKNYEWSKITYDFLSKILFQAISYSSLEVRNSESIRRKYEKFIEKINNGSLQSYDFYNNQICFNCHKKLNLEVKNWSVGYVVFSEIDGLWEKCLPNSCTEV